MIGGLNSYRCFAKKLGATNFDDRHWRALCVCAETIVSVRLNMIERKNGQAKGTQLIPHGHQRRYTGEILRRTRPKAYRAITRELAEPNASVNGIARRYRVSNHTVMGIREREAKSIAERKKTLAALLANVAERGAERMEETIGKASFRDTAIGTGIAVDKMLALTGQAPSVQVAVIMPTPAEIAQRELTTRYWTRSPNACRSQTTVPKRKRKKEKRSGAWRSFTLRVKPW